jgi:hypothetical protein
VFLPDSVFVMWGMLWSETEYRTGTVLVFTVLVPYWQRTGVYGSSSTSPLAVLVATGCGNAIGIVAHLTAIGSSSGGSCTIDTPI